MALAAAAYPDGLLIQMAVAIVLDIAHGFVRVDVLVLVRVKYRAHAPFDSGRRVEVPPPSFATP